MFLIWHPMRPFLFKMFFLFHIIGSAVSVGSLTRDWTPAPILEAGLTTGLPGKSPVRPFNPRFPSFAPMRRIPLHCFFSRALPWCLKAGACRLPPSWSLFRPFPAVFQLWRSSCIIHTPRFGSVENQALVGASHCGHPPPLPRRLRPSVPRIRPWRLCLAGTGLAPSRGRGWP